MPLSYYRFLLIACFLAGPTILSFGNIRVESSFNPATITLSNASTYQIIVHGSQQAPSGSVPSVKGLKFSSPPRTLRSASFINGVPSVRFELTFTVTPEKPGSFIVPSWEIEVENKTHKVPSANLQVLPPNQKDKLRQAEQRQQQEDLRQAAFLEFSCPRPFLFKGETVEAKVSLFLWDRLPVTRIDQVPAKNADGISITELGQPSEERNVRKFNKTYSVYSWNFGLTGAITGNHKITFESSIRVRIRNGRNSPFNNPFFNDPFFGFGREESLQVVSNTLDLEIKPLPNKDRPTSFQGAIGDLKINSNPDKNQVSVGDPIRLTCTIHGSGNFAAMPAPDLSFGDKFKVGPPAFSFSGNSMTKQEGSQTFEYIVTPLEAGILEIPPISFAYFNPEKEQYFSLNTSAHRIRVDPGKEWIAPADTTLSSAPKQVPQKQVQDLFQTDSDPGVWVTSLSLVDPIHSASFWILQVVLFLTVLVVIYLRIRKRKSASELLKKKEKVLLIKIREALKHKDSIGFHRILSKSIRLRVGIACKHAKTHALSSPEVVELLKSASFSKEVVDEALELLRLCDELEYAGSVTQKTDLDSTFRKSQSLLKKIK